MPQHNTDAIDAVVERVLGAGRIPGAAVAIVADGEIILARGYGYRDLAARVPMESGTFYPIASTTKAMNATLIGMLVDEGRLAWDVPVQRYLPDFRLGDPVVSLQTTLRDLLIMRTGLPRHDWVWQAQSITRAELVRRIRHLSLSAGFRERFQYNNITATAAGHVAEVVTGRSWEGLIHERIFDPLGIEAYFTRPEIDNVTQSYHENGSRELLLSRRLASEVTAPSGGSIYSTVENMARWVRFNLEGGVVEGRQLIQRETLAQIHSPQMTAGPDQGAPSAMASYAMGWWTDLYNGSLRLCHGGYLHDVNGEITLFPIQRVGIVSFTNFGFPRLARVMNQLLFDVLMGYAPSQSIEEKLAQYERDIERNRRRIASVPRRPGTSPSHPLEEYAGEYEHPAYGFALIRAIDGELYFKRESLELRLEHWHYDVWIARDCEMFFIHTAHAFDRSGRFVFETNADGQIAAFAARLEQSVEAIRFQKRL